MVNEAGAPGRDQVDAADAAAIAAAEEATKADQVATAAKAAADHAAKTAAEKKADAAKKAAAAKAAKAAATKGTNGAGATDLAEPRWETWAIQGSLAVIGCLVLVFAGFASAGWPQHFGSSAETAQTANGPITLITPTTSPTTTGSVTSVVVTATSSTTRSSTTTDTWLGVAFGLGGLLVLSAAFYRRVKSVSGFGISLGLSGSDVSDTVKQDVADKIERADPNLSPQQAAKAYEGVLKELRAALPSHTITAITPTVRPKTVHRRAPRGAARGAQEHDLQFERLETAPEHLLRPSGRVAFAPALVDQLVREQVALVKQ